LKGNPRSFPAILEALIRRIRKTRCSPRRPGLSEVKDFHPCGMSTSVVTLKRSLHPETELEGATRFRQTSVEQEQDSRVTAPGFLLHFEPALG
jgi:hypothetical protein